MPHNNVQYFAYGSNMFDNVIVRNRNIQYSDARPATLAGYALRFTCPGVNKYEPSFANIEPEQEQSVEGVLYQLSDEQFKKLFKSEGGMYDIIDLNVLTNDGLHVPAKTLVSVNRIDECSPSLRYLKLLVKGAKEKGLSQHYITRLEATSHEPTPPMYNLVCFFVTGFLRIKFFLQQRAK